MSYGRCYGIIGFQARLWEKGALLERIDEPELCLVVRDGKPAFVRWDDDEGSPLIDLPKPDPVVQTTAIEPGPDLLERTRDAHAIWKAAESFWALQISYCGDGAGAVHANCALGHQLQDIGFEDFLDPADIQAEIDEMVFDRMKRLEGRSDAEPTGALCWVGLVLSEFSEWHSPNGDDYNEDTSYLGRLDTDKLKLALVSAKGAADAKKP